MKKLIALLITLTLSSSLLLSCNSSQEVVLDNNETKDSQPFGTFTTTSVYGDSISDTVFSDYDLTMVNIWATWCPPCIGEMAELEEVYQSLPENVNMITLCEDGGRETDLAIEVLEENGCTFDALIVNEELLQGFMTNVQAFPTTVFVDRDGNVFGEKIEGAPTDPVTYYLDAIDTAMGELSL